MRLFYLTTIHPDLQGDLQEVSTLIGLRLLLGDLCIDHPKKRVLYGDFSLSPKKSLHGRGFTLYTYPIPDFDRNDPKYDIHTIGNDDVLVYGTTFAYNNPRYTEFEQRCKNVYNVDGHDDPFIRVLPCFKRECEVKHDLVFPFGFSIPEYQVRPLFSTPKTQLYQKTAPKACFSDDPRLLGSGQNYIYDNEKEYYDDMSRSWFGLTCQKGGWDCLRHYEIMAAGSLLLFKNYNLKPKLCAPIDLPCYTFSNQDEAMGLMSKLVVNNKPTDAYLKMLVLQREWLLKHGTCMARAAFLLKTIFSLKK